MNSVPPRERTVRMLLMSSLLAAACISCSDRTPTAPSVVSPGADIIVSEYRCVATVGQSEMECTTPSTPTGGAQFMLYGTNQVKLTSSNVHYDSVAQIFSFDVNVKNLLTLTIGTTTGVDTVGIKAFYETGPSATSYRSPGDTGTVSVNNADGYANFTGTHQPYHFYRKILVPSAVTPNQRWELHCPPTVATFSFVLRVFTRTATNPGVADTVPTTFTISSDSLNALYAPGKLAYSHPRASGPYPRSVVLIRFQPNATADEREAAINKVGGNTIGGDGIFYYVLVPDDGSANPLWQAVDQLRALPQVKDADPDPRLMIRVNYLRPYDGSGWRRTDWQLSPDSARGVNWPLEAISAPYAWGCESSGANASGAVVDALPQHSRLVHSIVAAPGNDSAGTTGVVWTGNVARTDASRDSTILGIPAGQQLAHDLRVAIVTASVINLSWGQGYTDSVTHLPRAPRPTATDGGRDSLAAEITFRNVRNVIQGTEMVSGSHPLYVVAAGNDQVDARFSGVPLLRNDSVLGGRVLVVGASDSTSSGHTRTLWQYSNRGTLVEIVAPGSEITMVDPKFGTTVVMDGTSLAAPYVAGVALMLKSFDPRLSSDSLKLLILEGAQRGGWTSGGYPYLNAYESLKAAARRATAPLCSNRIVGQNGSIVVLRDSATLRTETIVGNANVVWEVNPLHGGKRLIAAVGENYDYREFTWTPSNGSWATGSILSNNVPPGSSGPALSWFGWSHDFTTGAAASDTSVTVLNIATTDSTSTYRIRFHASTGVYATKDFTVPRQQTPTSAMNQYCIYHFNNASGVPGHPNAQAAWQSIVESFGIPTDPCLVHAVYNPGWRMETADFVTYSPTGDSAYIVVNYESGIENAPEFTACSRQILLRWSGDNSIPDSAWVTMNFTCGNGWGKKWSDGRLIYSVRIPRSSTVGTLSTRPIWNEQVANVTYFAVTESGREWIADYRRDTTTYTFAAEFPPMPTVDIYEHHNCTTRFQNLATGALIWGLDACSLWRGGFTGGMSSLRMSGRSQASTSKPRLTVNGRTVEFPNRRGGRVRYATRAGTEVRHGSTLLWRSWTRKDPDALERLLRNSRPVPARRQN